MQTHIDMDGVDFLINGVPTYPGRQHNGRRIEGLLLNSRMIQAVFDDENPETAAHWKYPDTRKWDPDRNVEEFCQALPIWRKHGLLAVTVGLQGGGPIYSPGIYDQYICTAFAPDGSLKQAYLERLRKVLTAADACGMVVIVNYFYWRQERFADDKAILKAAQSATEWLLQSDFRNILVDLKNEIREGVGLLQSGGIHCVLDLVRQTRLNERRLLISTSTFPTNHLPKGAWPDYCDFLLPHTNDSSSGQIREELAALQKREVEQGNRRPILINEDGPELESMEAALDAGVSWGYFDQGYGCDYKHAKLDWRSRQRERDYDRLSGFQTPPVNWQINTQEKRAFFARVAEITGCAA